MNREDGEGVLHLNSLWAFCKAPESIESDYVFRVHECGYLNLNPLFFSKSASWMHSIKQKTQNQAESRPVGCELRFKSSSEQTDWEAASCCRPCVRAVFSQAAARQGAGQAFHLCLLVLSPAQALSSPQNRRKTHVVLTRSMPWFARSYADFMGKAAGMTAPFSSRAGLWNYPLKEF